jgi:streptomycin 6-kinase
VAGAQEVVLPGRFLAATGRGESWGRWLEALPKLIRTVLADWTLAVDGSVRSGQVAVAVPVRTAAGEPAVLKLGWPHPEAEHEHLALRAWAGAGAVRLLQADPRRSVLLLERAEADRDLNSLPVVEACEEVASLYAQLHRPAIPQLRRLDSLAATWAEELSGLRDDRRVPPRYLEQAVGLARDFAVDAESSGTLLHTDLHYDNVLASARQPWLAIDPKPLSGDPAYEVAPLLWNRWGEAVASGNIRNALLDRMYAVVDAAGLDEDRVRAWITVRELVNVMWSLADGPTPEQGDWVTTAITIVKAVQR